MAIKIGADIELGIKKIEFIYVPYEMRSAGIGTDHSGQVLEIRPEPGNNPEQLLNNITDLLRIISKKAKQKQFKIISSPFIKNSMNDKKRYYWFEDRQIYCPMGGHIHLSWTNKSITYSCESLYNYFHPDKQQSFLTGTLSAIDALAFLIENETLAQDRSDEGYGQGRDFRYINPRRIELRRLPSFLYNPTSTRAILAFIYSLLDYEIKIQNHNVSTPEKESFYTKCYRASSNLNNRHRKRAKAILITIAEMVDWFKGNKEDAIALKYLFTRKLPLPHTKNILPYWGLTK